jgi:hypothetical protein
MRAAAVDLMPGVVISPVGEIVSRRSAKALLLCGHVFRRVARKVLSSN